MEERLPQRSGKQENETLWEGEELAIRYLMEEGSTLHPHCRTAAHHHQPDRVLLELLNKTYPSAGKLNLVLRMLREYKQFTYNAPASVAQVRPRILSHGILSGVPHEVSVCPVSLLSFSGIENAVHVDRGGQ